MNSVSQESWQVVGQKIDPWNVHWNNISCWLWSMWCVIWIKILIADCGHYPVCSLCESDICISWHRRPDHHEYQEVWTPWHGPKQDLTIILCKTCEHRHVAWRLTLLGSGSSITLPWSPHGGKRMPNFCMDHQDKGWELSRNKHCHFHPTLWGGGNRDWVTAPDKRNYGEKKTRNDY